MRKIMAAKKSSYKHILVAVDLSKQSDVIAKRAAQMAVLFKAKLSIVHVTEHSTIAYAGEYALPIEAEFEVALIRQSEKKLSTLAEKFKIPAKMRYLKEGSVKNTVTDLARKISADLIVVGTHGHHGLDVLLGSQANAILHAAHCDVWVIHIN